MGSIVRSATVLLADGQLVTCSPTKDAELFGLAMGGYGLFGILLKMEVAMVPNVSVTPRFAAMSSAAFAKSFVGAVHSPDVAMAYGRLSVSRARRQFTGERRSASGRGWRRFRPRFFELVARELKARASSSPVRYGAVLGCRPHSRPWGEPANVGKPERPELRLVFIGVRVGSFSPVRPSP